MDIKITGMKDLMKNLEELPRKIKKSVEGNVSFSELFNQGFMKKNTSFNSIEELFAAAGLKISSEEDLDNASKEKLNKIVKKQTKFNSWKEMLKAAAIEYTRKKIKGI